MRRISLFFLMMFCMISSGYAKEPVKLKVGHVGHVGQLGQASTQLQGVALQVVQELVTTGCITTGRESVTC